MWSKTYSQKVKGLSVAQLWNVWTDINQWHTWQDDVEYAKLEGEFAAGKTFQFKPKGGPNVNIELMKVVPQKMFVDLTRFPLAKMYGSHEFIDHGDEVEIVTTMSIEGLLSFVWRKIVAEGIVNDLPKQTASLIQRAQRV